MSNVILVNIADLPSDVPGKSWRQLNSEMTHKYKIGDLVEYIETGIRLFIVKLTRDCDETPLYSLSPDKDDTIQLREGFNNFSWSNGYSEECLRLIQV